MIGRAFVRFAGEVRREVGKVTWPTRKETTLSAAMVLVMVLVSAVFFFLVDQILSVGVRVLIDIGA